MRKLEDLLGLMESKTHTIIGPKVTKELALGMAGASGFEWEPCVVGGGSILNMLGSEKKVPCMCGGGTCTILRLALMELFRDQWKIDSSISFRETELTIRYPNINPVSGELKTQLVLARVEKTILSVGGSGEGHDVVVMVLNFTMTNNAGVFDRIVAEGSISFFFAQTSLA